MSTEWTDSKKWPDADRVAEMLVAIGKIKAHPTEGFAEALPELLAVLKVQRQGIGDVYGVVHKITRYNEASHEQFAQQIEVVRTLVSAAKEQDRIIRKLTKRVDSLEKKLANKPGRGAKVKKAGWFG
jgi:hypothetical protein